MWLAVWPMGPHVFPRPKKRGTQFSRLMWWSVVAGLVEHSAQKRVASTEEASGGCLNTSPQLIGGYLPGPTWTLHVQSPNGLSQCGHNLTRLLCADTVGCFTHGFSVVPISLYNMSWKLVPK